jgi:hypothetical protein
MGTYQPLGGRTVVLAVYVATAIVSAAVVAVDLATGRATWWFDGYLVASLPWNAYWWLVRLATSLSVGAGGVRWATPLRSGVVPAADLVAIRSVPYLPGIVSLRGRTGPAIVVLAQKGFGAFAAETRERFPHVEVRLRRDAAWGERVPGRSAWTPAPDDASVPHV